MRKKIIAGNWKMNKTVGEALALVEELKPLVAGQTGVDVVDLPAVHGPVCGPSGAAREQHRPGGAGGVLEGERGVHVADLAADAGKMWAWPYVILGHSETRGRFGVAEPDLTPDLLRTFGETDAGVNIKAQATLAAGLTPIVCVGETLSERQRGRNGRRGPGAGAGGAGGHRGRACRGRSVVFAYEPVWAIGTGETCAADEADRVCGVVRHAVRDGLRRRGRGRGANPVRRLDEAGQRRAICWRGPTLTAA